MFLFKKNKTALKAPENAAAKEPEWTQPYTTALRYRDVPVVISLDQEQSKPHVEEDFAVLTGAGIETLVREKLIPWIKGEQFPDREDEKIYTGLRLYEIDYSYSRIVARYSPTGEDGLFGEFSLNYESAGDYTADMLEAVEMRVLVANGKIAGVRCFDV